jgi:hypothetical protein
LAKASALDFMRYFPPVHGPDSPRFLKNGLTSGLKALTAKAEVPEKPHFRGYPMW